MTSGASVASCSYGRGFRLEGKPEWSFLRLRLKVAQKPYIVWPLGPKAIKCESLEPLG